MSDELTGRKSTLERAFEIAMQTLQTELDAAERLNRELKEKLEHSNLELMQQQVKALTAENAALRAELDATRKRDKKAAEEIGEAIELSQSFMKVAMDHRTSFLLSNGKEILIPVVEDDLDHDY